MADRSSAFPTATIWLIGPYPPPMSGQSSFNVAMAAYLQQHGRVRLLTTGAGILGKLVRYGAALLHVLFRIRRGDVVYTSLPGQNGAWFFALLIAALRLRGLNHWVHHHSYRPLVRAPLAAIRAIVALGGTRQRHILLCCCMRDSFARVYLGPAGDARAHALSNAFLFASEVQPVPRPSRPRTIGHLSVLTPEKGVGKLLEMFDVMAESDGEVRLILAGPVRDEQLEQQIHEHVRRHAGRVEYRGAVTGAEKDRFYRDIDVFVLASNLVDEAEPLVLLESYSTGIDVLATPRGCIPERIRSPAHLLSGNIRQDAVILSETLSALGTDWAGSRAACLAHAAEMRQQGKRQAREVIQAMMQWTNSSDDAGE